MVHKRRRAGDMEDLGREGLPTISFADSCLRILTGECGSPTCSHEEKLEADRLFRKELVERALNMKRSVHPMPNMDLYRSCLQKEAAQESFSMGICQQASDGSWPGIELDDSVTELDQLVNTGDCMQELLLSELVDPLAFPLIDQADALYEQSIHLNKLYCENFRALSRAESELKEMRDFNVDQEKAEGDRLRNEFLKRAKLKPPAVLRMIDCRATRDEGRVVLMDWKDCVQELGYSAISHTYGQDVYKAFDCTCASICRVASKPRCSFDTCPHDPAANTKQFGVVQDILKMCGFLWEAGVHYAWHDGVCIAQHDEDEVKETIQHIGWIYSNGKETIIFLHYVGEPRAPIWAEGVFDDEACRWHTRVWTLQEGALSKHRRYCIRMGKKPIGEWHIQSSADIVENVRLWYKNESSSVKVVDEETFYGILKSLHELIMSVFQVESQLNPFEMALIISWQSCIYQLLGLLRSTCFRFPTIDDALHQCAQRQSKHRGDRMNSILTLAGVKDFVAPKDTNLKASALKFYEKQGQKGLVRALFSINNFSFYELRRRDHPADEPQMHKWLPELDHLVFHEYKDGLENGMRLRVLGNGRLEVRSSENGDDDALLCCKKVRIVNKPLKKPDEQYSDEEFAALSELLQTKIAMGRSEELIEMNLFNQQSRLLYVSEAPSVPVGLLITNLQNEEGGLLNPSDGSDQCHISMEDGESFDAHLVTTGRGYDSSKMLLLHGNDILSGEVSKIGVFQPFPNSLFKELMLASSMKLEKVIII